jgi:hypothetical protein
MNTTYGLGLVPVVYLLALIWQAVRGKWRAMLISLATFSAALAVGVWAVNWSRSSTAWGAYFILPAMAGASGLLALAYGRSRPSKRWSVRQLGRVAMLAALGLPAALVHDTWQTNRRIAEQVEIQQAKWRVVVARRAKLAKLPLGGDSLDRMVRAQMHDRDVVLAALQRDDLSPGLLDTLAAEADLEIAVAAVGHPRTRRETLEWIYRNSSNPDAFSQPLAAHRNTSPEIMRDIYRRKPGVTELDVRFAGNSATPRDILDKISRTTTSPRVALSLLRNPAVDCELVRQVTAGPAATGGPDRDEVRRRAAEQEAALCRSVPPAGRAAIPSRTPAQSPRR